MWMGVMGLIWRKLLFVNQALFIYEISGLVVPVRGDGLERLSKMALALDREAPSCRPLNFKKNLL